MGLAQGSVYRRQQICSLFEHALVVLQHLQV